MDQETLNDLGEYVGQKLSKHIVRQKIAHGEITLTIVRDQISACLKDLKEDVRCQFTVLVDICGVDHIDRPKRFDVVYHLLSPVQNQRIRLKVETDEQTPVPSVVEVFPAANWFEREAYDMYGILFSGHPDLRRLLTDYGFRGHPLRKDFPVSGYMEVRYDDEQKRVVYEPVRLTQEIRSFDFMSPWEGAEYILPGDEKAAQKENGEG